jgi:hypothetical protein
MEGDMTSTDLSRGDCNVWGPVNQLSCHSNGYTSNTNELACLLPLSSPHKKHFLFFAAFSHWLMLM